LFTWDPRQYSRFSDYRLRPALDLLARLGHEDPRLIYDIGTGRGEMARLMADRWPNSTVIGTDTSADMLAEAAQVPSRVRWVEHDVRTWDPPERPDIIFSNAVLHWVPDHDELIVRLVESLAPQGLLGIQMPLSWREPSHRLMREILAGSGGSGPIGPQELRERLGRRPVADPGHYHSLLRSRCVRLDVWETVFYQELTGAEPVLEWVKGSALRPVLEGLDDIDRDRFLVVYRTELKSAYPRQPDGLTLYPFPRVFIVAERA
jgi:trans-aconitate 2-methyltransferase